MTEQKKTYNFDFSRLNGKKHDDILPLVKSNIKNLSIVVRKDLKSGECLRHEYFDRSGIYFVDGVPIRVAVIFDVEEKRGKRRSRRCYFYNAYTNGSIDVTYSDSITNTKKRIETILKDYKYAR